MQSGGAVSVTFRLYPAKSTAAASVWRLRLLLIKRTGTITGKSLCVISAVAAGRVSRLPGVVGLRASACGTAVRFIPLILAGTVSAVLAGRVSVHSARTRLRLRAMGMAVGRFRCAGSMTVDVSCTVAHGSATCCDGADRRGRSL